MLHDNGHIITLKGISPTELFVNDDAERMLIAGGTGLALNLFRSGGIVLISLVSLFPVHEVALPSTSLGRILWLFVCLLCTQFQSLAAIWMKKWLCLAPDILGTFSSSISPQDKRGPQKS